jgi:diguanylate cyclase (GGDEF)-like protein/PAS domain S-box-containing protein
VAGAVALLATDAAYGMVQLSGVIYENGGPLEAGWLSFYLLWGAAALHPSMRSLADRAAWRRQRFTKTRLALLTFATLMAPAVTAIQAYRHEHIDMAAAIGGSVTLFLLAIARMNGLVHKHEQAEGRERALREAGASFVAATDRDGLYRAAIEATQHLTGTDTEISLAVAERADGPLTVVASSAETATPVVVDVGSLPPDISGTLGERRTASVHSVDDRLRATLGMSEGAEAALVAPLYIRGQLRGALIVGAPRELPYQVNDGVEALASQTALALESAMLTEDLHRRKSEARFASLVQNSSDVMTIIDADSTIRYQSPSIIRVMGYAPEDLVGGRLLDFIHPDDVPTMTTLLADLAARPDGHPELMEFRWRHRDGAWLNVESLCSDLTLDPEVEGIVLNTRDVSERKAFEQQLSHQAFHDSITDLANRALFQNRVEHALERQRRDDRPIAVLFVDIDDFKTINDSLGHAAGDEVLREVGDRVGTCLRAADTAARLGGDEFAVLLEDAGYQRAAEVAERLMSVLEAPVQLEGKEVFVRASIGIAIGDDDRKGSRGATSSCGTPTWPCTRRRARARPATRCSSPRCTRRYCTGWS